MGNQVTNGLQQSNQNSCSKDQLILEPIQRTAHSRVVTVIVDDQIQFEVDVTDNQGNKTCGWLLAEVSRKYNIMLRSIARREARHYQAQKHAYEKRELRMPRHQKRYIVALKTEDEREGFDSWLNQYDRDLSILRDGTVLIAHFAIISYHAN